MGKVAQYGRKKCQDPLGLDLFSLGTGQSWRAAPMALLLPGHPWVRAPSFPAGSRSLLDKLPELFILKRVNNSNLGYL